MNTKVFTPQIVVPIVFVESEERELVTERLRVSSLLTSGYSVRPTIQEIKGKDRRYKTTFQEVPNSFDILCQNEQVGQIKLEGNGRISGLSVLALLPVEGTVGITNVDRYVNTIKQSLGNNLARY